MKDAGVKEYTTEWIEEIVKDTFRCPRHVIRIQ